MHTVTDYETRLAGASLSYTACATFFLSAVQDNVENTCKRDIVYNNRHRLMSGTKNVHLCEGNNAYFATVISPCALA